METHILFELELTATCCEESTKSSPAEIQMVRAFQLGLKQCHIEF